MREEIARLPPLLALHGDADQVIPIGQGRALVDRATALGGQGELIVYPVQGMASISTPQAVTAMMPSPGPSNSFTAS